MRGPTGSGAGKRMVALILIAAMLVSALATSASAGGSHDHDHDGDNGEEVEFQLTILHNNDGESELLPGGTEGEEGGVARFHTMVNKLRWQALRPSHRSDYRHRDDNDDVDKRGVILVSSGDNFLAGPAFTASLNDGVFYDAIALDLLRYDAIDLGNHDFDFGPDVLADFIDDFRRPGRPPYLSSNLDFSAEPALQELVDRRVIAKSTIVRERGERIGIIGATTENLPFISSPRNVVVDAVLPAVQAEIEQLERREVEIIILISHLQDIDGDIALASQLSGIDVMVAGGGDELLANPDDLLLPTDDPANVFGAYPQIAVDVDGNEIPVVTTSGQYGYVGRLVVDFDDDGEALGWDGGPVRVVDETVGPDGVRDNQRQQRKVVAPVQAFVDDLATNIIGQTEVELDGTRANVRSEETNEGNLIADAQLWQAQQLAPSFGAPIPQVAFQNGGGIRNDDIIALGANPGAEADITELDTFAMAPFGNFVSVVPDIPRSQFKEILENAVSRTQPGDIAGGTGRFAQVSGFSFTYSPTGTAQEVDADGNVTTAGTRVVDATLDDGTPIVTGGAVVTGPGINIAIADFLARGGDQYPFRDAPFIALGVTYQQALSNYITAPSGDGGLNGLITEAGYPEGGEGRVSELP